MQIFKKIQKMLHKFPKEITLSKEDIIKLTNNIYGRYSYSDKDIERISKLPPEEIQTLQDWVEDMPKCQKDIY